MPANKDGRTDLGEAIPHARKRPPDQAPEHLPKPPRGHAPPTHFISDVATSVSEWKRFHSLTLVATTQAAARIAESDPALMNFVSKVCHPECNEGSISAWVAGGIQMDPSLRSG